MQELYGLKIEIQGLTQALNDANKLNKTFASIGSDTKGLEKLQGQMNQTMQEMARASAAMVSVGREMSSAAQSMAASSSQMMGNLQKQAREADKALETTAKKLSAVGKAARANDLKNESWSNLLADIRKVGGGAEVTMKQLEKLRQRIQLLMADRERFLKGKLSESDFTALHGSRAFNYLKNSGLEVQESKLLHANVALQNEELAAQKAKGRALNDNLDRLRQGLSLQNLTLRSLDVQMSKLRAMETEYQRIERLKANDGLAYKSAKSDFIGRYGYQSYSQEASASRQSLLGQSAKEYNRLLEESIQKKARMTGQAQRLHDVWRGITASVGSLWLSWGNFAGIAAGLAVGSSVFQSMSVNREFGWQMEQVGIAADASGAQLADLKQRILEVNQSGSLQGPKQMAEGLRLLAQAGLNAEESMANLPTVMNFALIGGVSDERAAHFLAGLRSAWGLDTTAKLREGADQVAKAANVSQTSIEAMSEALRQSSSEAARFGLSVADTSAMLGILAKFNIEGSAAGTSMKRFLSDLAGRTPKATAALKELGLSFYNQHGMVKPFTQVVMELQDRLSGMTDKARQSWLKTIFDERGLKSANILLSEAGSEFSKMRQEVLRASENMGYTSVQAQRLGETAEGQFRRMKNAWEGMFASVGSQTETPFKSLMQNLASLANDDGVRGAVRGIADGFLFAAQTATGLVKAVAPLTPLLAGMATTMAAGGVLRFAASIQAASLAKGALTAATLRYKAAYAGLKMSQVAGEFSVLGANAAGAAGGITRAAGAMGVLRGAMAVLGGPVGVAALALGGLVAYMATAEQSSYSLREELSKLDKDLGAVNFEKFDKFNQQGYGKRIDIELGIGYKAEDPTKKLLNPQNLAEFKENASRINSVVEEMAKKATKEFEGSADAQREQMVMLTERKISLLKEQLENFDKHTAHIEELDRDSKNIRLSLEQDLYRATAQLMEDRTQLAIQQMRLQAQEAAKTIGWFDKLYNALTKGSFTSDAAAEMEARIQAAESSGGALTPTQKRYKYLVDTGMPREEAAALTTSTVSSDKARAAYKASMKDPAQHAAEMRNNPQAFLFNVKEQKARIESELAHKNNLKKLYRNNVVGEGLDKEIAELSRQLAVVNSDIAQAEGVLKSQMSAGISNRKNPTFNSPYDYDKRERDVEAKTAKKQESERRKAEAAKQKALNAQKSATEQERKVAEAAYKYWKAQAETESKSLGGVSADTAAKFQAAAAQAQALQNKSLDAKDRALANRVGRSLPSSVQYRGKGKNTSVRDAFGLRGDPTSVFGDDRNGGKRKHLGTDWYAKVGTQLYAPVGGNIVVAQWDNDSKDAKSRGDHKGVRTGVGGGYYIVLKGDDGYFYEAMHLMAGQEGKFKIGQRFEAGQPLALSGGTGAGKEHAHIGVSKRLRGGYIDPEKHVVGTTPQSTLSGDSLEYTGVGKDYIKEARDHLAKLSGEHQGIGFQQRSLDLDEEQAALEIQRTRGLLTKQAYEDARHALELKRIELDYSRKIAEEEAKNGPGSAQAELLKREREIKTKQTVESYTAQKESLKDWKTGVREAYEEMTAGAQDYATFAKDAFNTVFGGLTNALVGLASGSKKSFREMTVDILKNIAAIMMKMAMLQAMQAAAGAMQKSSVGWISSLGQILGAAGTIYGGISAAGGGATAGATSQPITTQLYGSGATGRFASARGNVFGPSGHFRAYASGGVVSSPTYFGFSGGRGLMGENGPEGILPLTRMANGDLGVQAVMGGGGTVVNAPVQVTVTVHSDGSTDSEVSADDARSLGNAIRTVVVQEVGTMLRQGGMIHQAIKQGAH